MADKPKRPAGAGAKKRNVIQITLDDATEARLQKFISRQRIKPDRAAVLLAALTEFLDREERKDKE